MPHHHEQQPIKPHEWQDENGICDFCDGGHCASGFFCPCFLVNKTADLIETPTEESPDSCGLWGCGWCVLNVCGGWGMVLSCLQRGQIRKRHGIQGGGCKDAMVAFCLPCCSVIQNYKEVEMRGKAQRAAAENKVGYQAQPQMRAPGPGGR